MTRRSVLQSSGLLGAPALAQSGAARPNILFLISDDHSAHDLGCYGNRAIRTPSLDQMAREGMRFTRCFVSSPQCSPNRSSIFTGCTPHTTATSRLHTPLPDWEPSVIELLKERGYFTGAFRKVHLGPAFEKRLDFYGNRQERFQSFFDALPAGRPFFLQVGFTDPHRPYRPGAFAPPHDPARIEVPKFLPDTPEIRADLAHYHDAISRMDAECGNVFEILRTRGLDSNTLVLFTGDNGMPFPGAKGGCYDAGLRVPLLARWPGRIAAGSVSDSLIAHVDLPSTWLDAAGIERPRKMQGSSFLNLLLGRPHQARQAIFAERNWHNNFDPIRAVRTARHKLIVNFAANVPYRPATDLEDSPSWKSILMEARAERLKPEHRRLVDAARPVVELYDLERDPDEFHSLATSAAHAPVRAELEARLSDWMHETFDFLPPLLRNPARRAAP